MLCLLRWKLVLGCLLLFAAAPLSAQEAAPKSAPDLAEFKTVDTAITTTIKKGAATAQVGSPAYLGVNLSIEAGKLTVSGVEDNSPAAKAGLSVGDVVTKIDGKAVKTAEVFRSQLQTKSAGEPVKLTVKRGKETKELTANLIATSRVMQPGKQRAVMGVTVEDTTDGPGATLKLVTPGMPAEKAGLKVGDVILKIDNQALSASVKLNDVMTEKNPGDTINILVKPQGKEDEKTIAVKLVAEEPGKGFKGKGGGGGGNWDNRANKIWKKDVYRLAIVCMEYPDVKHNDKVASTDWENALFSEKVYNKTSVTGQKVHGSLRDYYLEQSFQKLHVEGKCFDFITVGKKRMDYAAVGSAQKKTELMAEALDKLLERDGKDALDGFDGIFFLYAGTRAVNNRGSVYWPHRASMNYKGKSYPYYIVEEGAAGKMGDISVICHEFGHMLGLPDLYARPENPGSEGVGVWCAMSNQVGGGKPQHFCAWSKEQLGWINPAVIDPTVKQKLILSPIEDSPKECFKVLARPDGSEYFLLENRKKKGFDTSLPAEGLLIWRVVQNKPILEESHGVEGPNGPRVFLNQVPFPSPANTAFTPYTTPSSRAQLGAGLPVHITNIRRLPDGRITFYIGYEFY
jgi:M6 family metalloprotease-like protein